MIKHLGYKHRVLADSTLLNMPKKELLTYIRDLETSYENIFLKDKARFDQLVAGDYRPTVHAHWESHKGYAKCSHCGQLFAAEWEYCGHCGAKMDEEI